MTRNPTKRQLQAMTRRRQIMSSADFQQWHRYRVLSGSPPHDPYRAYMIDLGIAARMHGEKVWKAAPHWSDIPEIDYPRYPTTGRPRRHRRPTIAPPTLLHAISHVERGGTKPESAFDREVLKLKEKFIEHYHLPDLDVVFKREQIASPYYVQGEVGIVKPYMVISTKAMPRHKATILSGTAHELGHHAHYYQGFDISGRKNVAALTAGRIEQERMATKLASPFLTFHRPVQKWDLARALRTYHGTAGRKTVSTPTEYRGILWRQRIHRGKKTRPVLPFK